MKALLVQMESQQELKPNHMMLIERCQLLLR